MARILILANSDLGLYKFRKELIEELLIGNEVYISLPNGGYIKDLVHLGCKFIETRIDRKSIGFNAEIASKNEKEIGAKTFPFYGA